MSTIKVIKPGFQTTFQDLGRFGYSHFGVSLSGAADNVALQFGNILLDNHVNAPALEMTLVGAELQFEKDAIVSITGSNFNAALNGKNLLMWRTYKIAEGDVLKFGATCEGARCYLCIKGGFVVHKILGSASTHLLTSLGAFDGRALKKDDVLQHHNISTKGFIHHQVNDEIVADITISHLLHVTPSPQTSWFSKESLQKFTSEDYTVSEESNRMGLRLNGSTLNKINKAEMITEGAPLGAVQVSNDGKPIILFVEHQTTGGYPKIANVISADLHRIGQLRPRDQIKFQFVSLEEAYKRKLYLDSIISKTSLEPL